MMSLTMIMRFIIAHSETRFVEAYNETGVRLAELISCSTNVGAQVLVLSISVLVICLSFQHFQLVLVFF